MIEIKYEEKEKVDNLYKRLINPRMNFNIFCGKLRKSIDIVDRADYCNSQCGPMA